MGNEHNLNHPVDSYQIFMAEALIRRAPAEDLARYADIPWLETGDLFYMQKLAETIKAYRGVTWGSASDLTLSKTASSLTADQHEVLTYTIAIRHIGSPYTVTVPITMTDVLPAGLNYAGGTCTASAGVQPVCSSSAINWHGALSPASDHVLITYAVQVTLGVPSVLVNLAHLDAGTYGVADSRVMLLVNPYSRYLPILLRK